MEDDVGSFVRIVAQQVISYGLGLLSLGCTMPERCFCGVDVTTVQPLIEELDSGRLLALVRGLIFVDF